MMTISLPVAFLVFLAAQAQAPEDGYLVIPVQGTFGTDVTAVGLEEAFKAAQGLGVKHIVFTVDSKGGDQLIARDFYYTLKKYEQSFHFHAVVQEATGVAVAVVVWCEDVFIRPGGSVGGVNLTIDESRYPGAPASAVLLNIALMAGEDARRHGRPAELVRAMIDPSEAVHAYRDQSGRIQFSRFLPSVPREELILQHPAGKVLTLTDRQAAQLGFARPFDGSLDALGKELGICAWRSGGDAGIRAMASGTQVEKRRIAALTDNRREFLIDQNRRHRDATKAAIERFLNLANQWDPKLDTYSTYRERAWPWDHYWDGWSYDTGRLTPESRRRWRDRTDLTVAGLSKAHAGVLEMRDLEKEAKSLGQSLLYPEGKLDEMRLDLELKIGMLVRERDRHFKDD